MSGVLPLSDYMSREPHHAGECGLEQCSYCGCCVHGETLAAGCKVETAPWGMSCPVSSCGCEGTS